MRKIIILAMFALTACSQQPRLISQPKDAAKYEYINEECHSQAFSRAVESQKRHRGLAGFGALGALVGEVEANATLDKTDDYYKTVSQMWGECLEKHGYSVAG